MEPIASVIDKLKGFAKSTQDLANGVFHWHPNSSSIRRNPIEILKRLQREAFSDIMKLRDRQDKVERVLSFYKTSKGSPFEEASTHFRGEVEFLEALLMSNSIDEQKFDAIRRAGIKTGIHSKFTFETTVRKKDTFVAEFMASDRGHGDVLGSPLSLAKVFYAANISDWFSAVAIPVGAHCRDVGVGSNSSCERRGLTNYSSFGPPLLNQHYESALGLMVRRLNIVASLARLVRGVEMSPGSFENMYCFSTFGEVVFQLPRSTKLSILGVHQGPKSKLSTNQVSLGRLFKRREASQTFVESSDPSIQSHIGENNAAARSVALRVESELDESTRIGGWVEMKMSNNPKSLQWAVTMSDTPEDDFGWGLSLGGSIQGPKSWDHFLVEGFLKFDFGKRFSLQPALVYVMDGTTQFPALMLRSTWSL